MEPWGPVFFSTESWAGLHKTAKVGLILCVPKDFLERFSEVTRLKAVY